MSDDRSQSLAKRASTGYVAVLGAKVFFILAGFVQQPLLRWAVGLAGYGALSRVLAAANVVNNVVVSASTQGTSRLVAQAKGEEGKALRLALRVHAPIAVALALLFMGAAPLVASFQRATHITPALVVAGGVVLLYGLYAPLIGSLNGRQLFVRQASLDVLFATLRTVGLVGLGFVFVKLGLSGALGAISGFVVAALVIFLVALGLAGVGRRGTADSLPTAKAYLSALWPLALAQLFTNALMQQDITLLGRFLADAAPAAGLAGVAAEKASDEWIGVYRACQLFAFLPYQLLLSVTQILFPMLAQAKGEGNAAAVRTFVARGARLGAIATGLLVSIIVAMPETAIRFAYGSDVAARGASTLAVLTVGQGMFALIGLASSILSSLNRERSAAWLTFAAAMLAGLACTILVPRAAFGEAQLRATAWAVTGALAVSLVAASWLVKKVAGTFIPAATAARVLLAVGVCAGAGLVLPSVGRLMTLVVGAAVAAGYVVVLVATRELRGADVDTLRGLLRKRSSPPRDGGSRPYR